MGKNFKRILSVIGVSALCLTTAFADTSYKKQTVTAPKFGSNGASASEIKSITAKDGNLMNPTVGGGYTLTAKMTCQGTTGAGKSIKTQIGTLDIGSSSKHVAGYYSTIGFQSNLVTPVDVNVTAQMRTN